MNAASQVPSGVLISTSVSTISMPMSAAAVEDDDTDAAMPALIKRVAKSRLVMSPGCDWLLGWLFSSAVMVFRAKSLSHFAGRLHRQIIRASWSGSFVGIFWGRAPAIQFPAGAPPV